MPERLLLKVRLLRPGARLPFRATPGATGLDLYACLGPDGYVDLGPDVQLVATGIALEVPPGFDAQVRPRSGLTRQGVEALFGTIDSDYRGEVFVSMRTFGSRLSYRVHDGERIAQLVVARLVDLEVVQAESLTPTQRGERGHGSTGR